MAEQLELTFGYQSSGLALQKFRRRADKGRPPKSRLLIPPRRESVSGSAPQRHTDADLIAPPRQVVRHHAVGSDTGQQQGQSTEKV